MVKITRYLDPAPGEGNQGGAGSAAAGGAGAPTEPTAEQKTEIAEYESLLGLEETVLTPEQKTKLDGYKSKYDVETLDSEGKPLTAEAKLELEKTNKRIAEITAKAVDKRTAEETKFLADNTEPEVSLYDRVNELSGIDLKVDYKGVDPTSAEGIVIREDAIRDNAIAAYDNELKEKNPQAYQYLLHLQAGGKPEDFFKDGVNTNDFLSISLSKTDTALQESVYRKALNLKGISQEQIDLLVTHAKDKGKLFDLSKVELETLQKKQEKEEQTREAQAEHFRKQEKAVVGGFFRTVEETLEKGIQGVVVPKAERAAFTDFVANNITYQDGKLIYNRVIDAKTLPEELAAAYFKYKKGDLSKIVENKAKNLNVQNLKKNFTVKITPKTSSSNKHYKPLGEI